MCHLGTPGIGAFTVACWQAERYRWSRGEPRLISPAPVHALGS